MVTKEVYAVATTDDGTRLAMRTAEQIATSEGGSVVVIVPHVVPFGVELDRCGHDLARLADPYRAMALAGHADTTIRVCACREPAQVSKSLSERAQVVVAGRRGRWRLTRAERLARALELAGHPVVFVGLDRGRCEVASTAGRVRSRHWCAGNSAVNCETLPGRDGLQGLFRHFWA